MTRRANDQLIELLAVRERILDPLERNALPLNTCV